MKIFEKPYTTLVVTCITILLFVNFILASGLLGVYSDSHQFLGISSLYNLISYNPYLNIEFFDEYLSFFRDVLHLFTDFKPILDQEVLIALRNFGIDYLQLALIIPKMTFVTLLLIVYWIMLLVYLVVTFFYFITGGYMTTFPSSDLPDIFITGLNVNLLNSLVTPLG